MKRIAVVILNWNTQALLAKFLPLVIEHSSTMAGAEVIVADNASSDSSVTFLTEHFPNIRRIVLDCNYGFAEGYNRALKQVEADYYVLLNSDIETTPYWLEPLSEMFEHDSSLAAVVPKIKSYSRKNYFEHAGAAGGYIDKYGFPFCAGRLFDTVEEDLGQYDHAKSVFWGSGAALFIKADLYHSVGGLDADFFAHMEEIDLCWRLKNRGYSVWYCPRSVVYHVGGGTLAETSPFKLYLNYRNNLFLLYKNLPKASFQKIMLLRKVFDGVAALQYLIKGKFKLFGAVVKAHRDFYKSLSLIKEKRNKLLASVINTQHEEMSPFSVVIRYFARGQKTFDKLKFYK